MQTNEEAILYEMANFTKEDTGLNPVIFLSPKMGSHGCRVKVSNQIGKMSAADTFSIAIPSMKIYGDMKLKIKDLDMVLNWVLANQETIIKYWNSEISTKTLANTLIKI
jgi:hypothetical protein